jgi:hypothetical protein
VRALVLMIIAIPCFADQSSIQLPVRSGQSGYDEVRTSSGAFCRQSVSSAVIAEAGVVQLQKDEPVFGADQRQEAALYGRITWAIGTPKRLDCARLYELEIETLRAELDMMREQREMAIYGSNAN